MEQIQSLDINEILDADNICELIDKHTLNVIADEVVNGYKIDYDSTSDWREKLKAAEEVITQTVEVKNTPFQDASNVKFPMITLASIYFASTEYTQLIQKNKVARFATQGKDPEDFKYKRANRLEDCHNFQLLVESGQWESSTDKMLHGLSIAGTTFKKVYYDKYEERPVSEYCSPKDIILNMNTKSLEEAVRITHCIELSSNDIIQKIREGLFLDVDVDGLCDGPDLYDTDKEKHVADPNQMHSFIEQHFYFDLDGDGYKEPYIGIVHLGSGRLLGLYHRIDKIIKNKKGEIVRIKPMHHFADYHFIRFNEDGDGFYSTGYSSIMYALNHSVNSVLNQLIDAGKLNNMQSGYYNANLRIKNKDMSVEPGEFKGISVAPGTKLGDNLYPLPTKEPSQTLFALLGFLVDIGKDLSSINDALQGKQAATHVSPTTMMTLVEQGMKIYNAIHKRLFNSFKKEFELIYKLNQKYLSDEKYKDILDDEEANKEQDFKVKGYDMYPIMDPTMSSKVIRMIKAEAALNDPYVDPRAAREMYYESLDFTAEEINKLLPPPDPNAPPSIEDQEKMAQIQKLQAEAQKLMAEAQSEIERNMIEAQKVGIMNKEADGKLQKTVQDIQKAQFEMEKAMQEMVLKGASTANDTQFKEMEQRLKAIDLFIKERKAQVDELKVVADLDRKSSK